MTKDRLTTELGRISQLCVGSGFDLEATLWLMDAMLEAIADFEEGEGSEGGGDGQDRDRRRR